MTQRSRGLLCLAIGCLIAWSLAVAGPASAECTMLDPWPPFAPIADTAERIIVAEVLLDPNHPDGEPGILHLRVDQVLRGNDQPGVAIDIRYLPSGLPEIICPGGSYLRARSGDVLALAFNGSTADGRRGVNTAAWIHGAPDTMQPGLGRITVAELQAFTTPTPPNGLSASPHFQALALIVLSAGAALVLLTWVFRDSILTILGRH